MCAHMHVHAHICRCVLDIRVSLLCGFLEPYLFQEAFDSSCELGMMFSNHKGATQKPVAPQPWVFTLPTHPPHQDGGMLLVHESWNEVSVKSFCLYS